MYARWLHEVWIELTRTTVDVLVGVGLAEMTGLADVVGAVVVDGRATGSVVVTGSVDAGATTSDVVDCVGSNPSSTVGATVLSRGVPPAVTVEHPVAPSITASTEHTRQPVIPEGYGRHPLRFGHCSTTGNVKKISSFWQ